MKSMVSRTKRWRTAGAAPADPPHRRRGREGGASAADLYAFLEKDDDKGKRAVNAALMALKREGAIQQAGRRQPYTAVEHPRADEAA